MTQLSAIQITDDMRKAGAEVLELFDLEGDAGKIAATVFEAMAQVAQADNAEPAGGYPYGAIEASKPWIAEGISRRAWFRKRAKKT